MAVLTNYQQDTISGVLHLAKYLHDHALDFADFNVLVDAAGTGIKAVLAGLPNGGQDALNELGGLGGMTVQEFEDIAYVVTAQVGPLVVAARSQLAAVRKAT